MESMRSEDAVLLNTAGYLFLSFPPLPEERTLKAPLKRAILDENGSNLLNLFHLQEWQCAFVEYIPGTL